MSLKTLISVSSRLTGDPSSCQRNFILFSKEFEAGFQTFFSLFLTSVPIRVNGINRKVWSREDCADIPGRPCRSDKKKKKTYYKNKQATILVNINKSNFVKAELFYRAMKRHPDQQIWTLWMFRCQCCTAAALLFIYQQSAYQHP